MTTTHRISIGVALSLALATTAAPATARPFNVNANGSYVPAVPVAAAQPSRHVNHVSRVAQASSPVPCGDVCSGHGYPSTSSRPTVVRVSSGSGGFDWGDAGIGVAGGIALSMVGVGGALVVSQRRSRRTRATTAVTS